MLREDQGGERAGVSDGDRRRLVFGVTERRADALVVAPLSLFGMGVSMRTSAKSASFEFAGVTNVTLTPYPKNLVLSFRRDGMVAGRSEEHTSELQSLMRTSYAVFCLKTKTNKPVVKDQHI